MTSLFISKNLEELELLPQFCKERNFELIAHSFLSFNSLDFHITNVFDCVFFSSPRSVKFFMEKHDLNDSILIACAGKKTKEAIEKRGLKVDFVSKNSGKISDSSLEFANWIQNRFVLFPVSTISKLSYLKHLKSSQHKVLEVYETRISPADVKESGTYVFTSPSNVDGFFKSNTIPEKSVVISWGESTTKALLDKGIQAKTKMILSSEEELITLLENK